MTDPREMIMIVIFLVGIAWYFCSQAPLVFTRHRQRAPSALIQINSQPRPMTADTHACIDNLNHNYDVSADTIRLICRSY